MQTRPGVMMLVEVGEETVIRPENWQGSEGSREDWRERIETRWRYRPIEVYWGTPDFPYLWTKNLGTSSCGAGVWLEEGSRHLVSTSTGRIGLCSTQPFEAAFADGVLNRLRFENGLPFESLPWSLGDSRQGCRLTRVFDNGLGVVRIYVGKPRSTFGRGDWELLTSEVYVGSAVALARPPIWSVDGSEIPFSKCDWNALGGCANSGFVHLWDHAGDVAEVISAMLRDQRIQMALHLDREEVRNGEHYPDYPTVELDIPIDVDVTREFQRCHDRLRVGSGIKTVSLPRGDGSKWDLDMNSDMCKVTATIGDGPARVEMGYRRSPRTKLDDSSPFPPVFDLRVRHARTSDQRQHVSSGTFTGYFRQRGRDLIDLDLIDQMIATRTLNLQLHLSYTRPVDRERYPDYPYWNPIIPVDVAKVAKLRACYDRLRTTPRILVALTERRLGVSTTTSLLGVATTLHGAPTSGLRVYACSGAGCDGGEGSLEARICEQNAAGHCIDPAVDVYHTGPWPRGGQKAFAVFVKKRTSAAQTRRLYVVFESLEGWRIATSEVDLYDTL